MFSNLKNDARFIAIVVLALLATIVDSTLYLVSFLTDGLFMAALVYLAWGFVSKKKSTGEEK